jgi:hypothetical protein
MKKSSSQKQGVAPRSTLAIAGKKRPPRIEKLAGDEVPPPEAATKKLTRQKKSS